MEHQRQGLTLPRLDYPQFTTHPMILSQASRLTDRQTVWVARKNDDSPFYKLTTDYGVPATVWAAQFADIHADDVKEITFG